MLIIRYIPGASLEPNTLGQRLRLERLKRGHRQQDVAEILDCSVFTVLKWEAGRTQPGKLFREKLYGYIKAAPKSL